MRTPGVLGDTAMGARRQSGLNHHGDDPPMGRLGTSVEVAEVVRFAASPAASLMTGTDLLADGGYVASANCCALPCCAPLSRICFDERLRRRSGAGWGCVGGCLYSYDGLGKVRARDRRIPCPGLVPLGGNHKITEPMMGPVHN
jgi:hypothetical protein